MRHAFVFDVNRCTGCQACQLACTIENDLAPDRSWRAISTFNERRYPDAPLFHLSLACNHCADPACMTACPALAYSVDADSGAVLIDGDACIGCGYCAWACPYDAPRFDADVGVMTKCTFCNHRLAAGLAPACAALCPTGALSVSPLPEEELSQAIAGFPSGNLQPALKIIPLRQSLGAAAAALEMPPGQLAPAFAPITAAGRVEAKITLKKEWPLAVFTWLASLMFAMLVFFAAARSAVLDISAPQGSPARLLLLESALVSGWMPAAVFAAIAVVAMALGGAHLGRKARAWRIVLNVAGSPLSREIVAFALFVALGTGYLLLARGSTVAAALAVGTGLLALAAIEDVYRYTLRPAAPLPHSANVLLTGPFLAALLLPGVPAANFIAIAIGLSKALLYTARKLSLARRGSPWRPTLTVVRLGIGVVVPGLIAALSGPREALLAGVLIGELIDRCELYDELEVMTPRLQMARDLAQHRAAGGAGPAV